MIQKCGRGIIPIGNDVCHPIHPHLPGISQGRIVEHRTSPDCIRQMRMHEHFNKQFIENNLTSIITQKQNGFCVFDVLF